MANPHKGEVEVEVGGKTYTMVFSTNCACAVEERLDRPWLDILYELQQWMPKPVLGDDGKPLPPSEEDLIAVARRMKMTLMRTLIWGALRDHHKEVTIEQAGAIMQGLPESAGGAFGLISKLWDRASPPATDESAENPPKPDSQKAAPAGTGPAS